MLLPGDLITRSNVLVWLDALRWNCFYNLCRPIGDRLTGLNSSQRLDGRAQGSALRFSQSDDGTVENVRANSAPNSAFAAAASEPDFHRRDPKFLHAFEPVGHSQRHTFHDRAGHEIRFHIARVETVENTAAARQIRGAFALKVGKKNESIRARRRIFNRGVELRHRPAKK